jgi:ElaB/YqjD/DUF883 family membrane-anchored ribosome-binding protein
MQSDIQSFAANTAGQSKSFITGQLDERSTQLGKSISSTASDLRRIADDLQGSETVAGTANLANRGADTIERIGSYLQEADGEQLITDAETFARDRPWAVAAVALTAGFAAARVLKASSTRRYRTSTLSASYGE